MEAEKNRRIPEKYLKLFTDEFLRLPSRITVPTSYVGPPDPYTQDQTPAPSVGNIYMVYPGLDTPGNQELPIHDNVEHCDNTSEWDENDSITSNSTDDLLLVESSDLLLEHEEVIRGDLDPNPDRSPTDEEDMSDDEALFIQFLTSFSSNEDDKLEDPVSNEQASMAINKDDDIYVAPYHETRSSRNLKKLYKLKIERQRQKSEAKSHREELKDQDLDKFPQKLQNESCQQRNCLLPHIVGSYAMEENVSEEWCGDTGKLISNTSTPKKNKDRKIHFAEPLQDIGADGAIRKGTDHNSVQKDLDGSLMSGETSMGSDDTQIQQRTLGNPNRIRGIKNNILHTANRNDGVNDHSDEAEDINKSFSSARRFSLPESLIVNSIAAKSITICREIIPEVIVENCELSDPDESRGHSEEGDSESEINEKLNIATPDLGDLDNIPFPTLLGNCVMKKSETDDGESLEKSTARFGLPIAISMEKIKAMLLGAVNTSSVINEGFMKLSGEVEEKNRTITQLEERVRELEGNRKFMDSVDAGRESMERTRHGTGSSAHQSTIQPIYAEHDPESEDSFSSTGGRTKSGSQSSTGSGGGGRPGYGADLDGAQDDDELRMTYSQSDSNGEDDKSRKPNQFGRKAPRDTSLSDNVSHGQRRMLQYESPEQERVHLEVIHPVDLPTGLTDLPSGDNLFPSSLSADHAENSTRDQMNREMQQAYQREIDSLSSRLQAVEDLNDSMRKELRLYDNLKTSVGLQSSPVTGSHSSQTAPEATAPGGGGGVFLERDLMEIRALRQQLEISIKRNDKLREQLDKNMKVPHSSAGGTTNIYLPSGEMVEDLGMVELHVEINRLKSELREKSQQVQDVERLAKDIIELKNQLNSKNVEVRSKDRLLSEKETTNQRLRDEVENLQADLKNSKKEAKTLKDEMNRLQEHLVENQQLNNTLQLELSVYDKMHDDNKAKTDRSEAGMLKDAIGIDLNLLLEEIRQLRIQLVRTIENNNSLRAKLEEQLARSPRQTAASSNINIHHLYAAPAGPKTLPSHAATSNSMKNPSLYGVLGETYLDRHSHEFPNFRNTDTGSSPPTKDADSDANSTTGQRSTSLEELRNSAKRQLFGRSKVHSPEGQDSQLPPDGTTGTYHSLPLSNLHGSLSTRGVARSTSSSPNSRANRKDLTMTRPISRPDASMRYSVYDPLRPPNESPNRVGADLRCLYAVGEIDDYELLKRDIGESISVLSNMDIRIKDRLRNCKVSTTAQSLEYSTLRNLSITMENLGTLLKDQQRLINLFWHSQLPKKNHGGHHYEIGMGKENDRLRDDVVQWRKKYLLAKQQLGDTENRLQSSQKQKETLERIVQQLTEHHGHLLQASSNLQVAASH